MEPKVIASFVSSLVSQALLLLLLSKVPLTSTPCPPPPSCIALLHLLSSSAVVSVASLRRRKRKRPPEREQCSVIVPQGGPDSFRVHFKMSSATFEWLSSLLDPLLSCGDLAGSPVNLPGSVRLAIALNRLAAGVSYADIAARFSVPVSAAKFCARRLCRVLCTNFRFWLAFPPPSNLSRASCDLPGCCGAVTCAQFGIHRVQIVADASSKIVNLVAGFWSDSSEFEVLKRSSLYEDMESGKLLGDSQYLFGYGNYILLPWLMVKYKDPMPGSTEEDFNTLHHRMCQPLLKTVNSLRNWGIMNCLVEEGGKAAVACIATCAILHNALLIREDYSALVDAGQAGAEFVCYCEEITGSDNSVDNKAVVLRSMLAAKAREIRDSLQFDK